jgi:hypothetical protein
MSHAIDPLGAISPGDRETVLSFIAASSRATRTIEDALETIQVSLALKHALGRKQG